MCPSLFFYWNPKLMNNFGNLDFWHVKKWFQGGNRWRIWTFIYFYVK